MLVPSAWSSSLSITLSEKVTLHQQDLAEVCWSSTTWSVLTRAGCAMLSQGLVCGSSSLCNPALSAGSALSQENQGDLVAMCCSLRSVWEALPNRVCACLSTRGASPCPGNLNKITRGKREPAVPPDSSVWESTSKVWFVVCEKCLHLTAFHRKPVRVII